MIKKLIFIVAIIFLSSGVILAEANKWHTVKSTHFIVNYKNAELNFIDKLAEKAEDYYSDIADDLGFRRYNFWLWDNRAKIYIYDDAADYQSATGQPGWSAGCAIIKDKVIHSYPDAKGFFDSILPHELGHIIFREFVGFDNSAVPLWLDEGVACYQEKSRREVAREIVRKAVTEGDLISLLDLSGFKLQSSSDSTAVNLYYAEAVSVVDYLIREFGSDYFVLFCQGLRDKRNLEQALNYAYRFKNTLDLDKSWQAYYD